MHILIVQDQLSSLQITRKIIERLGSTVVVVTSGSDALVAFERERPDLVLLALDLLDINGFEVARRIRFGETDGSWTPIIFMLSPQRDDELAQGLAAGGDDFLYLPIKEAILTAKLRAMQRIVQMRTSLVVLARQLDAANQELRRISASDGLTGIANRRVFDTVLEREWRRARRTGQCLSLILCDIDFFKPYNDTLGHLAGDDCLRRVAAALSTSLERGGDAPARYGGEEFAVILPETPLHGALIVAEKARQAVCDLHIPHPTSPHRHVTMSMGIAEWLPGEGDTPGQLIAAADQALYQAKEGGRNRVCHGAFTDECIASE
ncbi:MAG TPA: diguanylate cyclase [Rhodocyclaceae bacterium]|nr:diguanylate cyclase [Rhodocyclaceae bacterium]